MHSISEKFPKYTKFNPSVPVYQISLGSKPASHRFYDSSPISPSGRLIAYTEFSFEDRLPIPGDRAYVVVVDLFTSKEIFRIETYAWDTQLGAQPQWGCDDSQLLFNQMDPGVWVPYGMCVNPANGNRRRLEGTIYHVSPDGDFALSPSLTQIQLVQPGYGVIVPSSNTSTVPGFSKTDGLFLTNISNGKSQLLVSFADIVKSLPMYFNDLDPKKGQFYGFHPKWSPDGSKIMFIIRWRDKKMRKNQSRNWIITMNPEGKNLKVAMNDKRWIGGHHPNWCPDSQSIIMNLSFKNKWNPAPNAVRFLERFLNKLKIKWDSGVFQLKFAKFKYDGSDISILAPNSMGSGHPTLNDTFNAIVTDAYPHEPVCEGDGTVPIRMINLETNEEINLVRIHTEPRFSGPRKEWRVDPHPAWDSSKRKLVFNGYPNGVRQVFLADLSDL